MNDTTTRVAWGAALLDEKVPDWYTRIDVGILDLNNVTACIVGQLAGNTFVAEEFGGSVLGQPIEVVSADHQHKPEVGLNIARQWIDVDGVDVILDVPNSGMDVAHRRTSGRAGSDLDSNGGQRGDRYAVRRVALRARHRPSLVLATV